MIGLVARCPLIETLDGVHFSYRPPDVVRKAIRHVHIPDPVIFSLGIQEVIHQAPHPALGRGLGLNLFGDHSLAAKLSTFWASMVCSSSIVCKIALSRSGLATR